MWSGGVRAEPKMETAGRMGLSRSVASTNSAIIPKIRQDSRAVEFCSAGVAVKRGSFSFAVMVWACGGAGGARFSCVRILSMPTLLLVDGSSYLYRAFHALPDLRTAAGEPTGAVRGVLSMLRRLESDYKAEYRACVFDAKGKTFRDDLYPDYKSHRPPMPEDLRAQIEPLHQAVEAEGWPLLVIDGVEADDVIGTLTRQAVEAGWGVVISPGDKDLTQLVRTGVRWVNTMSEEVLDEAGVTAKFGVPPERIVDYLALVGDTVDNVPGVEKCGPKTAAKWLAEFGTLDNLVANADKVGGKVGENLRKHLDFLPLGRTLVTVVTDLNLPVKPADLPARADDKLALKALYERLEFKTWLKELESNGERPGAPAAGEADIGR